MKKKEIFFSLSNLKKQCNQFFSLNLKIIAFKQKPIKELLVLTGNK